MAYEHCPMGCQSLPAIFLPIAYLPLAAWLGECRKGWAGAVSYLSGSALPHAIGMWNWQTPRIDCSSIVGDRIGDRLKLGRAAGSFDPAALPSFLCLPHYPSTESTKIGAEILGGDQGISFKYSLQFVYLDGILNLSKAAWFFCGQKC